MGCTDVEEGIDVVQMGAEADDDDDEFEDAHSSGTAPRCSNCHVVLVTADQDFGVRTLCGECGKKASEGNKTEINDSHDTTDAA
jgi:hypothetical protein